jgi:hypothetical protein
MKHPLKRRIGMRYSNEFYFVMPAGLVSPAEIPAECGLVEAGQATYAEWKDLISRSAGFFNYDPERRAYCMITVPALWRVIRLDRHGSWSRQCCGTRGANSLRSLLPA